MTLTITVLGLFISIVTLTKFIQIKSPPADYSETYIDNLHESIENEQHG